MSLPKYAQYKDSGEPLLGDLPAHWSATSIKRCFTIYGGSTPKSDEAAYWDGEIVWVSPADLSKLSSIYIDDSARKISRAGLESCGTILVPEGSIVLSTRAPIGSLAIAKTELCTNQGCKSLVPRSGANEAFYAYYLLASTEALNLRGKGTTFLELSADELGAFKAPRPPFDEQSAIVAFLDRETKKIDRLIAKQEKLLALLAEKRQATIAHAVTRGLNPNSPLKDSGVAWLGTVPAHWEIVRLGQIFRESGESGDESLPILSVSIHNGVSNKELDDDELDRKVTRSEDRSKYKKVMPLDLVYNMMRAWQGGFGTVQTSGMVSPAYVVAHPINSNFKTDFIEQLLRTPQGIQEVKRYSRGITDFRLRLYWDEFKNIKIALPPLREQQEIMASFGEVAAHIDGLVEQAAHAIDLLRERRSALITAAVTGKIDVRDAVPQELAT